MDHGTMYFYFREVQGGNIKSWTFTTDDQIESIKEVISSLEQKTTSHGYNELELEKNTSMCVENILNTYPDFDADFSRMLLNNFSSSLLTRAREAGKYAVLIIFEGSVVVCHTDSEEKTITRDADVLERLLDTDNVNKYARFDDTREGRKVRHFERHLSKSFYKWLGVDRDEMAYDEAGEVRVITKIEDSLAHIEYSLEEFEQKFVIGDEFELVGEILRTPNDEFPVTRVELGSRKYDTVDEFEQAFYSLYYDLNHYQSEYQALAQSVTPHVKKVIDQESKVTVGGPNGDTRVKKGGTDFCLIFADRSIELSASWRLELKKAFEKDEERKLHHVGPELSEEPIAIGPFQVFNDIDVNDEPLNDLHSIAQEIGTGEQLSSIIYSVIFRAASHWSPSPVCHFFAQMAEAFESDLDAEGMVLRDEGDILELKRPEWVEDDDPEDIAMEITREIQSDARLLLVGIDEEEQRMAPVERNEFDSEKNEKIRNELRDLNGHHEEIKLSTLPLGGGKCLLFIYAVREDQTFDFDLGLT